MKSKKNKKVYLLTSTGVLLTTALPLAVSAAPGDGNRESIPEPSPSYNVWTTEETAQYSDSLGNSKRNWAVHMNYDDSGDNNVNDTNDVVLNVQATGDINQIRANQAILNNEVQEWTAKINTDAPWNWVPASKNFHFAIFISNDLDFIPGSFYITVYDRKDNSTILSRKKINELDGSIPGTFDKYAYPFTAKSAEDQAKYPLSKNNPDNYIQNIITSNVADGARPFALIMDDMLALRSDSKGFYNFMNNFNDLGHIVSFWTHFTPKYSNDNDISDLPIIHLEFQTRKKIVNESNNVLINNKKNLLPTDKKYDLWQQGDVNPKPMRSFVAALWGEKNKKDTSEGIHRGNRRIKSIFYDRSNYQDAYVNTNIKVQEANNQQVNSQFADPKLKYQFYYDDLNTPVGSMDFTENTFNAQDVGITKKALFSYNGQTINAYDANSDKIKSGLVFYSDSNNPSDINSRQNLFLKEEQFTYDHSLFTYQNNINLVFNNEWYNKRQELISEINAVQNWNEKFKNKTLQSLNQPGIFKYTSRTQTATTLEENDKVQNVLKQAEYSKKIYDDVLKPFIDGINTSVKYTEATPSIKEKLDKILLKLDGYYTQDSSKNTTSIIKEDAELDGPKMEEQYTEALNAIEELDGVERLAAERKKTQAIMDSAHWISDDNLKQKLQKQINDITTVRALQNLGQQIATLDGFGRNIHDDLQDSASIKNTDNYNYADQDKKLAFDEAVKKLQEYAGLDNKINKEDTAGLQEALKAFDDAKNALNGNSNIGAAKDTAKSEIDKLTHLTENQKKQLKAKIDSAQNFAELNNTKTQASDLDTAMSELNSEITSAEETQKLPKYTEATNKGNLDTALSNAKEGVKNAENQSIDPKAIKELKKALNTKISELNGDQKLQDKKNEVNKFIDSLTHLNNAQKEALKNDVNSKNTISEIETIKTNAQTLDNSMKTLKEKIDELKPKKSNVKYVDADSGKKTEFDEKLKQAENLVNIQEGQNSDNAAVQTLISELQQKWDALDGDTQLQKAKAEALKKVEPEEGQEAELKYLTNPQKEALKAKIASAPSKAELAKIMEEASKLNDAMKKLSELRTDTSTTIKGVNYKEADKPKQTDYQNAVREALKINSASANPTLEEVNAVLKTYDAAKKALNGEQKLSDAKAKATEKINSLSNLNDAQKQELLKEVEKATSIGDLNTIQTDAENLNTKMNDLKTAIAKANEYKENQNYKDATETPKKNFDEAISGADSKVSNQNISAEDIDNLLKDLSEKKEALDGAQELTKAQEEANNSIDDLTNLTESQKTKLKDLVNDKSTKEEVAAALEEAKKLDEAMKALKDAKEKAEQAKDTTNYNYSDEDKKEKLDTELSNAQGALQDSVTQSIDLEEIKRQTSELNTAVAQLNGDAKLQKDKEALKQKISNLPYLNDTQKTALKQKVDQATNTEEVQAVETTSDDLNNVMRELTIEAQNDAQIKDKPKYTDAESQKQSAFDSALEEAQNAIKTNGDNLDQAAVTALKNKLSEAKAALNGDAKINEAKTKAIEEINKLSNLNDAQKAELIKNINDEATDTLAKVNKVLEDAKALDDAMKGLKDALQTIKDANYAQDSNYLNATESLKNNFDGKITDSTNLTNSTGNAVMNVADINNLKDNLNNAYNALDGNKQLEDEKTSALADLENKWNNLNKAQKEAVKNAINASQLKENVAAEVTKALELNEAMGDLNALVNSYKNPSVLGSEDYTNADQNLKEEFKKQSDSANQLVNLESDEAQNLDKNAVVALKDALKKAREALNGEEKLNTAKTNALAELEKLTHLNDAQKEAAKKLINGAKNDESVANALSDAQTLNQKMDELNKAIEAAKKTKETQNYKDASSEKSSAFDTAYSAANRENDKEAGTAIDSAKAQELINALKQAQSNLDGVDKITQSKQDALDAIDNANNLTDAQKKALKEDVGNATTLDQIEKIKEKIQPLDDAMKALKEAKTAADAAKATSDYTNADSEKQTAFDEAKTNASNALLPTANLSLEDVKNATTTLQTATKELNGDENLATKKQELLEKINQAENLNKAQKDALKLEVNNAESLTSLNNINAKIQPLDDAMSALKDKIKALENVKNTNNYKDATPETKEAYDTAAQNAQDASQYTTGSNLTKEEVEDLVNNLETAHNGLNGDKEFEDKKINVLDAIDKMQNLNDAQKKALKEKINTSDVTTVDDLDNLLGDAQRLNEKMSALKEALDNAKKIKEQGKYLDATNKGELDNPFNSGNAALDKAKGTNLSEDEIQTLINNLKLGAEKLDGEAQLATKKTEAKNAIDAMENLTAEQKEALKKKIDEADTDTIEKVNKILENANSLDKAMKLLKDAQKSANSTKNSPDYRDSDADKKENLDSQLEKANTTVNSTNSLDVEAIKKEAKALNSTTEALNGDEKFDALKEQIEQALAENPAFENSNIFQLSSPEQQKAYKDAIKLAQDLKDNNKLNNQAQTVSDLQKILDDIKAAKDQVLSKIADAINEINALPNLSDEQKADYINKLHNNPNNLDDILADAKAENNRKQDAIDQINNLENLSEIDKQKYINDVKNDNATSKENVQNIVDKAKEANTLVKDIIKGLKDLANNYDLAKANELKDKIKNLTGKITNPSDFENTLNQIENNEKTKELLDQLRNTPSDSPEASQLMENINKLTKENQPSATNPELNNLIKSENTNSKTNKDMLSAIQKIVDGIKNNNFDDVNKGNKELNSMGVSNNNELVFNMKIKNALNIFAKDPSDVTSKDIEILKSVKFDKADEIIKTAYLEKLNALFNLHGIKLDSEELKWPWWLVLATATAGALATIYGIIKNKKK